MRSLPLILLVLTLAALPSTASAHQFEQGKFNLGVGGSLSIRGDRTVLIASLGLGFYVVDGLEVGVGTSAYFGADPFVFQVTPGVRYVFWFVPSVHPYIGAFYRHWFVARETDLDTIGGRLGLLVVPSSSPIVAGVGVAYERVVNPPCAGEGCAYIYPEVTVSISF